MMYIYLDSNYIDEKLSSVKRNTAGTEDYYSYYT